MKKYLAVLLLFTHSVFAQVKTDSLHVTYIANEGFILETKNKKILIDALFTDGYNAFASPTQNCIDNIMNAQSPFDNIDALLLTHYHKDHADSKLIRGYLTKHPQMKLITSKPSLVFIDGEEFGFITLKNQFEEMTPQENQSVFRTVNGIDIQALGIKHLSFFQNGIDLEEYMFNMGYHLNIDGINVFHSGDASMETFKKYIQDNGKWKAPVDVAIIYFDMLQNGKTDIEYLKETINPKYIIIMHVWNNAQEEWTKKVEELKVYFPNIWFPKQEMESRWLNTTR
ncbi:MBL fold metallo-hydrolase [Dysgonomonas macrotermitis]|uniref:L-ascorbate metabolism protein UlaG, beta-lactamase superfamily n=1 Tax=Dysgonomonas macrotermitis TaxID=1346286 RepID=A0A1M5AYH2_9BACT|nr:MBL fold metallo-hydrolase [Dysgonomonas macrotermitis]SHF35275.1 L-ascorbate metabolism protein UlaG, beta-lactamase superfamily [Dysgonomonas macrotermitis]